MKIVNAVTNGVKRIGFRLSNHAPEILVVGGVGALVGAGVWACKASFGAKTLIDDYTSAKAEMEEALNDPEVDYPEELFKIEKRELAFKTAGGLAKAYAGPVALAGLGATSVLYGHNMRHKRYLAAAAAWAASQADYKGLYERVKAKYGEEEAYALKHDIQDVVEEYEKKDEEGNVEKGVRTVKMARSPSMYARLFDEECSEWRDDPIHNRAFLQGVQNEANRTLQDRGFLTLNEVYLALGLEPNMDYGIEAGWVKGYGDDFVDFGLFNGLDDDPAKRAFINGYETCILLDFNCSGRIREINALMREALR